jgi:hypothetical protein
MVILNELIFVLTTLNPQIGINFGKQIRQLFLNNIEKNISNFKKKLSYEKNINI